MLKHEGDRTMSLASTTVQPNAPSGPLTSGSLALLLGSTVQGPDDLPITGIDTMERAGPTHLTFIRSSRYANAWTTSKARVALVSVGVEVPGHDAASRAIILVKNADLALNTVLSFFSPPGTARPEGIHPTAVVDPAALVSPTASIGPQCVIEAGAVVEDHAVLVAHVFIGAGARVGAGSTLHPRVCLYERCRVGRQCLVHAGAVIGADGFGFIADPSGRGLLKVPHIGDVVLGDGVEIGANTCIDRGKFGTTSIGAGTKIDNLVQIGHNVVVGRSSILCGQVGIGGSTTIGDGVVLGGQVGVSDHLTVGSLARVGAGSGVLDDVPAKATYVGYPAIASRDQLRHWASVRMSAQKSRKAAAALAREPAAAERPGVPRRTLRSAVRLTGVGLFTARPGTLIIHPSDRGGILIRMGGVAHAVNVRAVAGESAKLPFPTGVRARNTTLAFADANGFAAAATVEHVLSALAGLGITDAELEVLGPDGNSPGGEVPMFDGSAGPIVGAILSVGFRPLEQRLTAVTLTDIIRVEGDAGSSIVATPRSRPGCSYTYIIDYGTTIPRASVTWDGDADRYAKDIAPARTFCLVSEAAALRERGMFMHVTPRDMLVLDDRTGLPIDNGLQFPDEPARHKLLDLIGDLSLVGAPLQADIVATKSGHALAHEMCRRIEAMCPPASA
jgi:UDP-3-O-[3-hydroxymyristoyl] glucosamine N-acyltransferase